MTTTTSSSKTSGETVLRQHRHERGFVIIDNDVAGERRISFGARGLHAYMLTRPADWRFSADRIAGTSDVDGRKQVLNYLRELETFGYLRRDVTQAANGKFRTVITVSDRSIPEWAELGTTRIESRKRKGKPAQPPATTDVFAGDTGSPRRNAGSGTPVKGTPHPVRRPTTETHGVSGSNSTHTPHGRTAREDDIDDNATAIEVEAVGVCGENSEDQNPDTDDHTAATHEAVSILRKCVDPTAAKRLGEQQVNDLAAITARILLAGHAAGAVCGRINGITRADTHSPYKILLPVLEAMATETPQKPVSGDSVSVEADVKRSCRADCVDGQIRCATDCPTDCKSTHAPLGPDCSQCRPTNRAVSTTADTDAQRLVNTILDDHDVPMTRRAAPGALQNAQRGAQSLLNLGMSTEEIIEYVDSQGPLSDVATPLRILAEWFYARKK